MFKKKNYLAEVQKCEVLLGSECADVAPRAHIPLGGSYCHSSGVASTRSFPFPEQDTYCCWMKEQEGLARPTPGSITLMVHLLLHTSQGQQKGLPTKWCSTSLSCARPSFPLAFHIYQSYFINVILLEKKCYMKYGFLRMTYCSP